MVNNNSPIDYATTYFERAVLTAISGRPDYKALHWLFKELKANAASVMSDLGGGLYGHLGLLLTAAAYLRLTPHPYVRPAMPAALVIPHGTTNHEATCLREEWQEEKRIFRETIDVETALIKQIVAAIEPVYLDDLQNPVTNSITMPVADVMTHLFTRYGEVTQATLDAAAEKVRNMTYYLTDPINNIFTAVQDLGELSDAANNPYSDRQLLEFGLGIIQKTQDFERAQLEWITKPEVDKTWANFKTHFTTALLQLETIRGPTMQTAAFHQANALVEQQEAKMQAKLEGMQTQLIAALQEQYDDENKPPATNDNTNLTNIFNQQLQAQREMQKE